MKRGMSERGEFKQKSVEESRYEIREGNAKVEYCEKKEAECEIVIETPRGMAETPNLMWQVLVSVVGVERAL